MSTDDKLKVDYVLVTPQQRPETQPNLVFKRPSSDYECVSCIDDVLFPPQRKLPPAILRKCNQMAIGLCILTLVFTMALTSLSYFTFTDSKSCGIFAFAFDALLQAVSSLMLIWRFSSTSPNISVGRRETIATLGVAFCNVISAISIFIPTVKLLLQTEKPKHPKSSLIASSLGLILYSILFFTKYKASRKLGSAALMTDAIDSLSGALIALTILVSSVVLVFTTKAWFMDYITALGIAFFMFLYAATVMVEQIRLRKSREDDLNSCMFIVFGPTVVKS